MRAREPNPVIHVFIGDVLTVYNVYGCACALAANAIETRIETYSVLHAYKKHSAEKSSV
jgi:hypothetical protein